MNGLVAGYDTDEEEEEERQHEEQQQQQETIATTTTTTTITFKTSQVSALGGALPGLLGQSYSGSDIDINEHHPLGPLQGPAMPPIGGGGGGEGGLSTASPLSSLGGGGGGGESWRSPLPCILDETSRGMFSTAVEGKGPSTSSINPQLDILMDEGDGEGNGEDEEPLDTTYFDQLPPEPEGECDVELQTKIIDYLAEFGGHNKLSFTDHLKSKKDFGNPELLQRITEVFGIDQVASNYPPSIYNPHGYEENDYIENIRTLQRQMEAEQQAIRPNIVPSSVSTIGGALGSLGIGKPPGGQQQQQQQQHQYMAIQVQVQSQAGGGGGGQGRGGRMSKWGVGAPTPPTNSGAATTGPPAAAAAAGGGIGKGTLPPLPPGPPPSSSQGTGGAGRGEMTTYAAALAAKAHAEVVAARIAGRMGIQQGGGGGGSGANTPIVIEGGGERGGGEGGGTGGVGTARKRPSKFS